MKMALIVGSGLTGAVIARILTDHGWHVRVIDRRSQGGGNVRDAVHASGIRYHVYGPHYFRTNDDAIWSFATRFGAFYPYAPALKSWVDGRHENWPIAESYIRRQIGSAWQPEYIGIPRNFEEASLALMPRLIYERFVAGYTRKQWGVAPALLAASLAKRFDVRADDDPRLMRHRHQGLPVDGYSAWMAKMLDGIEVLLNCDYLENREAFSNENLVVYTGPIDEYYGFDLGRLRYRGQRREHEYLPCVDWAQPCGQVNNPDLENGAHIRTLEWKHMLPPVEAERLHGTLLTRETPEDPTTSDGFEYPFPDSGNTSLYTRYKERAAAETRLVFCGRLGEYRYYDMDQAIARAMLIAERLMQGRTGSEVLLK